MPIKNIKTLLTEATSFPAAIEAKLPAGAPKVSTMLLDAANQIPAVPDFPIELPDLPAPPAIPDFPAMPGLPGGPAELRKVEGRRDYVSGVVVREMAATPTLRIPNGTLHRGPPLEQAYTQPIEGVVGTVTTRRGM
uniref:Uncharacterized protein n=1 Tax=viral metagenome TaxID=1070528 RepID=A0A6M3LV55_9ZZZZ